MAIISENTQTAVVSTEHTLATDTTGKVYLLAVDCGNMANGDVVELRVYTKVRSSSTERLAYVVSYAHAQADPNKYSPPVPAPYSCRVTLKQTAGSARNFDWTLLSL